MSTSVFLLLIFVIFVWILFFRSRSNKHEQQRSELFRHLAGQLDMQFSTKMSRDFRQRLKAFNRFNNPTHRQGHRLSTIINVLQNNANGVETVFFECSPRGGHTGRNMEPIFYFKSSFLDLPNFHIRRSNIHQIRFLKSLGKGGVDIDHSPFSQKYLVKCSKEDTLRRLFCDEFLDFISSNDTFDIDGNGDQMIVYRAMYDDGSTSNMGRIDLNELKDVKQQALEVYKYLSRPA
ncbi:hypothetical protein SAMN02745866_01116 [Alteromonadaceae bacterium Bs31]|nr:hypothetical protein SAMN02745866_01116 [Alteromonadaceae bacterium Bs31]